jgi:hypothetical protein
MINRQPIIIQGGEQAGSRSRITGTVSSTREGSYEIKVGGHLDEHWSEWLGDLAINHDDQGNTLLTGIIPDQAALHGILAQIRDLGIMLVSLRRIES